MSASGFIYIMINPSLEGLVKIGKTTRSPVNRMNELSSATGVPTPFQLVYWAEFSDCDSAERVLHNLFADRGSRVSSNREFFRIPTHEAVSAVISLQQGKLSTEYDPDATTKSEEVNTISTSLLESLLKDANEYLLGSGGKFQDTSRAIAIFKKAIDLGSVDACITLGNIYRDYEDIRDLQISKNYLLRGVELGSLECYGELGRTFVLLGEKDNGEKAWKHFLEHAAGLTESNRGMYCMFCIILIADKQISPNLLPLLRPYGKEAIRSFEATISHCTNSSSPDVVSYYQRKLAVANYHLLGVLPTQSGRIRYVNAYGAEGGWIAGDDGRDYHFDNTVAGIPALGDTVAFNGLFPDLQNHGKAECVVVVH
jgi:hypothetical protein